MIARLLTLAVAALLAAAPGSAAAAAPPAHAEVIGHSVRGRAIRAVRIGPADAPRAVLAVACVHGDEPSGIPIARRLRTLVPPPGSAVWVIERANPDGCAAGTRRNAHDVDLNRNSPWHWRRLTGVYRSGPRAWSEPESRALDAFVRRIHPAVTVWYHQHMDLVDASEGGDVRIERAYARRAGMRLVPLGRYPGSFTGWQNANLPGTTAFVVELPAGALPRRAVARHAKAVLALAARPAANATAAPREPPAPAAPRRSRITMRPVGPRRSTNARYKAAARRRIARRGYRVLLNVGDQRSDLAGGAALAAVKLPNPMYLTR